MRVTRIHAREAAGISRIVNTAQLVGVLCGWLGSREGILRRDLNADAVVAEDCDVRGDRDLLRKASVSARVKLIHAGVLPLVKAEIPDVQEFPLPGKSKIVSIYGG
jgi:hypothetical protein